MMAAPSITTETKESLIRAAVEAMKNAYAPYSGFKVGAALLTTTGEVFAGCNVENASYGLTICAERNAIFAAVARLGKINIRAIAVVNEQQVPCSPCGACRQVITEFGPEAVVFYLAGKDYKEMTMKDLLPDSFRLES